MALAALLLLAISACRTPLKLTTLSSTAVTATATPVPTATPSPTPTATPTPLPTPTPTPAPDELLSDAVQAMHDGNYKAAAQSYRDLLDRRLDDETAAESQLGLGTAYLRDGQYTDAADAFRSLLAAHPATDEAHDAHFLLGEALVGAGQPLSATEAYSAYLSAGTVITPYVNRSLGDAFHAGGIYTSAVAAYQAAIAEAPHRPFEVDAREKLALSHAALENYAAAVDQYDAILEVAERRTYRARIQHQAAETLILAGQIEAGYGRHLEVVETYPTEEHAYLSLVKLVEAGRPVDDLLRGVVDYHAEAYVPAVAALYRYINAYPDTHSGDAHWYAGLSFLEADSPVLAAGEFQMLIETHPENTHWGDAWMELADTSIDRNQADEAVETYREFARIAPNHPRAPEALWEAAQLLERSGALDNAAETYVDCQARYPNSDYGPPALLRAGLLSHELGELADAAEAWKRLIDTYPDSSYHPAALLWLGKVRLARADLEAAEAAFERAHAADPLGYYGLRAAQMAADPETPAFPPTEYRPARETTEAQAEAEAWLADWLELQEAEDLAELPPDLAADPRLRRGLELWRLGRFQQARVELENLRRAGYSDAVSQYQLALTYRDIGLYRSSILCAARVLHLSPITDALDAPAFLLRLAYPTYYENLVLENARRSDLDPLLIFAVIRQESLFESLATSHASAHGLMQVIPPTGAEIAAQLDWPPDYETPDLYRPYVSLRFGTYYLAQQRDRFGGRIDVALSAYNGGPFNAQQWLERASDPAASKPSTEADPDLYLELITLHEPRLYIQRIKEHLAVYEALYGR